MTHTQSLQKLKVEPLVFFALIELQALLLTRVHEAYITGIPTDA